MSDLEREAIIYDKRIERITRAVIGKDADPSITSPEIEAEIRRRLQEEVKQRITVANQSSDDLADK